MPMTLFAADSGDGNFELYRTDGTGLRTTLVKDIKIGALGSNPSNNGVTGALPFAVLGNFAYFAADDGVNGMELWRSDGTEAGTVRVTNLAGAAGYSPGKIAVANGRVFFEGFDGVNSGVFVHSGVPGTAATFIRNTVGITTDFVSNGSRIYWGIDAGAVPETGLWSTDGVGVTAEVTGVTGSPSYGVFNVNGLIYAPTNTGIFKITGTTGVAITPAAGNPAIPLGGGGFNVVGSTLFFRNQSGTELWSTATAGTTAARVATGLDPSGGISAAAAGSLLVFVNTTTLGLSATGTELWVSNGTNAGTVLLKDILPGSTGGLVNSGNPRNLTTVGNLVYFQASDGKGGLDLWKTDGTALGTVLVQHILTPQLGVGGPIPSTDFANMTAQNGLLMFSVDGPSGVELWRSDGTIDGTFQVRDINTTVNLQGSFVNSLNQSTAVLGGFTFFTGADASGGVELWKTNGTPGGTTLLKDINPGLINSLPANLTLSAGKVFFTANDGNNGWELWVTDGTPAGTVMVKDIRGGVSGSNIAHDQQNSVLTPFGAGVLFSADDGVNGQELWFSDGTAAGTVMLANINPGSSGGVPNASFPYNIVVNGAQAFFLATTTTGGTELYVTNGTPAGTVALPIVAGTNGPNINSMVLFNGKLYFTADSSGTFTNFELWTSDGTPGGTMMVKDINPTGSGNPFNLVVANGKLFFLAGDGGPNGTQVWVSDGTSLGTVPITSISNFSPQSLVSNGAQVYFTGFTPGAGQELYTSTGGAPTLIDVVPGANGSSPQSLINVNGTVFFIGSVNNTIGQELYKVVGTTVTLVKDINPTAGFGGQITNMTQIGTLLYFVANNGVDGQELWRSDGTSIGTFQLANINTTAGVGGSIGVIKSAGGNSVVFQATDNVNGSEQWFSDGTAVGTFRLSQTVLRGGSNPGNFTSVPLDSGAGAAETLTGTPDGEYIDGGGGNDTISGAGGNDLIIGGAGADLLNGGTGSDVFRLSLGSESTQAASDIIQDFVSGEDVLDLRPLNLLGSAYVVIQQSPAGSVVLIDSDANGVFETRILFSAGSGITVSDLRMGVGGTAIGDGAAQLLRGADLVDVLAAGGGNDTVIGGLGGDSLYGQAGDDLIYGEDGVDFAYGDIGSDTIVGGAGGDSLLGEDGQDFLYGEAGNDLMIAGEGNDFAYGGLDNDTIIGGAGGDALLGEDANDQLFGDAGGDLLIGGAGDDVVFGGLDGDTLIGGLGADTLNGEDGIDDIFGDGGGDVLIGGLGDDRLYGGADGDQLFGGDGGDTLSGEDGGDILSGGVGADALIGGAGGDRFLYTSALDSTASAADLIVDFTALVDLVDLAGIDANTLVGGDQAFVWVGGFTGAAGQAQLIYDAVTNRTTFLGDTNGDGTADVVILFNGGVGTGDGFIL